MADDFFLAGGKLNKIFKALKSGVASIGLQKAPKAVKGRGGDFTRERPRLICLLDQDYPGNVITIDKCKNWRDPEKSPVGLQRKYKIVKGCHIMGASDWQRGLYKYTDAGWGQ